MEKDSAQSGIGSFIAQAAGPNAHASIALTNSVLHLNLDRESLTQLLSQVSPQLTVPAPEVEELFEIVRAPEDIAATIFRSDRGSELAPYDIPHVEEREGASNLQEELYAELRAKGALLLQSRAGLGKTRETAQLAARCCSEGWNVCIAKSEGDSRMSAPAGFPDSLRRGPVLFVVDDLHQRVSSGATGRKSYADQLNAFLEFFSQTLLPPDLRILATVRTEPHHYDRLGFDAAHPLWRRFSIHDLPEFSGTGLEKLLLWIAAREKVKLDKAAVPGMVINSDRTPRTLEQNVRLARHRGVHLTAGFWLENQLNAWQGLFQQVHERHPEVDAVYAALHLLRMAELPTRFEYVARLATKLAGAGAVAAAKALIDLRLIGLRQGILDAFGDEQLRDSLHGAGVVPAKLDGHWSELIDAVEGTVRDKPEFARDLTALVEILLRHELNQDAEQVATRAISDKPDNSDLYYLRSKARKEQENYTGAEEDLTAAVDRGRRDASVYYLRGFTRLMQLNFQGADEDFTDAINRGESDPAIYYLRGSTRRQLDQHREAAEDLTRAIGFGIERGTAYLWRAGDRLATGDYRGAEDDCTSAFNYPDVSEADVYELRGHARRAQNNYLGAEEDYTAAIDRGRNTEEVYYFRGAARFFRGSYPAAEEDLTAAIHRGMRNASVYYLRGLAQLWQGKLLEGEEDLSEAIGLGQDDAVVYAYRAFARLSLGYFSRAEEDCGAALSRGEDGPSVYLWRGKARFALRKYAQAEEDYTSAISRGLDDAEVYYCREQARRWSGDRSGADLDRRASQLRRYKEKLRSWWSKVGIS